ncbi:MAG: MBL fold metallo-hydrolase [Candidatus Handelsmanbacteria bacterium]|nr:MBL fold metallo-hydrolase [Candidatus Handelsmanbacteria bacterium]
MAGERFNVGELEVFHLRASRFRLDGGTMFGVVPRPLWERASPPDGRNRVELACNCLLVRQPGQLTLIDTGCGQDWTPREQEIFAFDPNHSLSLALASLGVRPEEINRVILTHLHFDHAGGATHNQGGHPVPLFPNAAHLVQRREWEDALDGVSIMKSSYRPECLLPLEQRGLLHLLDGDTRLDGAMSLFVTGGHTAGHQGVRIAGGGRTLVYPGELLPTAAHLRLHWNMAYDMFPYQTLLSKRAFLAQAQAGNWTLALNHDPHRRWSRLVERAGGLEAEEAEI